MDLAGGNAVDVGTEIMREALFSLSAEDGGISRRKSAQTVAKDERTSALRACEPPTALSGASEGEELPAGVEAPMRTRSTSGRAGHVNSPRVDRRTRQSVELASSSPTFRNRCATNQPALTET